MNENAQPKRMGSVKRSWLITKSSWRIFRLDKEIVMVPLITGLLGILVAVIGFGGGFLLSSNWHSYINGTVSSIKTGTSFEYHITHMTYAIWIVTSAVLAVISSYTLAAMVGISLKRLRGGDPTLSDGWAAVKKNFWALTIFSLFSFGVVQIMQRLQAYLPFAGKILAFLGQLAWGVASFFAVPVIVDAEQGINPIQAAKESMGLIKKTWRESGVNQFTLGALFGLLVIFELLVGAAGTAAVIIATHSLLALAVAGPFIVIILLTILVSSALEGIAKAVLYYYAATGEAPAQFDRRLLHEAFTPKKARRIFS